LLLVFAYGLGLRGGVFVRGDDAAGGGGGLLLNDAAAPLRDVLLLRTLLAVYNIQHRKLGRDYLLPRQCLHFDVFIRHRTEPYSVAVGTAKSGLFFQGLNPR